MTLSVKQIYAALAVLAVGIIPMFLKQEVGQYTLAVALIAAIVNVLASSGGTSNAPIVEAVRRAANGERDMSERCWPDGAKAVSRET